MGLDEMYNGGGPSMMDMLNGTDGLTKAASMFEATHGRELSPDGLQAIMFLAQNGSPDLSAAVLHNKRYQSNGSEITAFTEKMSAATAHKEMLEAGAKSRKDGGGS